MIMDSREDYMTIRCEWTGDWNDLDSIMVKYHDKEWG